MINVYNRYKDSLLNLEDTLVNHWNNGISHPNKIGNITQLFRMYEPKTSEEFYYKYISDSGGQRLLEASILLSESSKIDIKICQAYIYKKIFVEAFGGCYKELEMKELVENKGYDFAFPTVQEDQNLGVDGKVFKDNKLDFMIQLKPVSFFRSNRPILVRKRIEMMKKWKLTVDTFGVETFYLIYDNNGWIKNENNYLFRISDLIERKWHI